MIRSGIEEGGPKWPSPNGSSGAALSGDGRTRAEMRSSRSGGRRCSPDVRPRGEEACRQTMDSLHRSRAHAVCCVGHSLRFAWPFSEALRRFDKTVGVAMSSKCLSRRGAADESVYPTCRSGQRTGFCEGGFPLNRAPCIRAVRAPLRRDQEKPCVVH